MFVVIDELAVHDIAIPLYGEATHSRPDPDSVNAVYERVVKQYRTENSWNNGTKDDLSRHGGAWGKALNFLILYGNFGFVTWVLMQY
ncbi:MAG: hypothetical protein ACO1NW_09005 [Chitinophagaceae bacterium]